MTHSLHLADGLALPVAAVTEKFAICAQSGAGKSYCAGRLAELMIGAGAQVLALDPVGTWWGLRAAADGRHAGLTITVFGGEHGDVPLRPASGELVADVLVDQGVSAVLDVSEFTPGETKRFVSDFADRFFQRKKRARSPVHLFVEEAHVFVPQDRLERDESVMLGRMLRLLKIGRNYGVGWTLISQEPQSVHKRALNNASVLVALRTVGRHERKAIADWVSDKASEEELALVDRLPKLATGEAHVWSPSFLKVSKTVKISRKETFDSSATPEFGGGKVAAPRVLADVDVARLRKAMAAVVAEAEAKDPTALQRRVAQLERELAAIKRVVPAAPTQKTKIVERRMFPASDMKSLERAAEKVSACAEAVAASAKFLLEVIPAARMLINPPTITPTAILVERRSVAHPQRIPVQVKRLDVIGGTRHDDGAARSPISGGPKKMLETLARRHPVPLTKVQLGVLSGYVPGGSTFRQYLPILKRERLVVVNGEDVTLTNTGLAQVDGALIGANTDAGNVRREWLSALELGPRKMLEALIGVHPDGLTHEELGAATGYVAGGSTYRQYLPKLKRARLARVDGGRVFATNELF